MVLMLLLKAGTCLAVESKSPSFEETSRQALSYAHLEAHNIQNWQRNVRKAPLLPRLQLGFDRQMKNFVNIGVQDSVSVTTTGVAVGPPQQNQAQNFNDDYSLEVKAVWYLDQLLFSKDHLDISQESRELARERERILGQVRQFYFKRERGLKELELLAKSGAPAFDRELKALDVAESVSALDSLTGGWFGANLK